MKILDFGVAVIEGDSHVSAWVAEHGRLDIAAEYLRQFRRFIPEGGTVVDAGAMLGDHTQTYSEWVGPGGRVLAFEPNPQALQCLEHNMAGMPNVSVYGVALGASEGLIGMHLDRNAGASHLSDYASGPRVQIAPLDSFVLERLDFIKIDVEGFEANVLEGGRLTIARCRPAMLVEVNGGALARCGCSRDWLLGFIRGLGYSATITEPGIGWGDPQYDVICLNARP